ncbi:MAG: S41 family peptidase [Candidatus Omnitrophota bacterium]
MRKKIIINVFMAIFILAASMSLISADSKIAKEETSQKADKESVTQEVEKESDIYRQLEIFSEVISIVRSEYVDEVKSKDLIYGAMKGMIQSLDKYSEFMDPESYNEMKVETEGEFGGIGIEIAIKDDLLTVIAPIEDTPAYKAGVKSGDKIVKINGEITRGITLLEAVKKLRGKPATQVSVTILREDEGKILDFDITRDLIKVKSIRDAKILEDGIGYVRLSVFQERSAKDLEDALVDLEKKGMNSLILDLRNDPGGLLNVAAEVAGKFLSLGEMVVYTKGRDKRQDMEFRANDKKPRTDYPLAVLVDQGSASGSEIVAGAVQDHKRGIIIGVKTFGKGSVQTVIPLPDGSAVRLTTSKYYTPSGRSIHGEGIMPDIVVERQQDKKKDEKNTEEIFEKIDKSPKPEVETKERDNQLASAIDAIKTIKIYKTFIGEK